MTFILSFIDRKVWRGAILWVAASVCLAAGLSGCGSSSSSTKTPKGSGIKKRVLISNQSSSVVQLLDAQNDAFVTGITVTAPTRLLTHSIVTAAVDSLTNTVALIDNPTETIKVQPALPGTIDDIVLSGDGKTAFAVMRNLGKLAIINVPDGTFAQVALPGVARLVLSPNSTRLLAFSDDAQSLPAPNNDCFFVMDTATHNVSTVKGAVGAQPYSAVFNGTDNQAFILNCGAECGGTSTGLPGGTPTAASLRSIDLSGAPALSPTTLPLPATASATVGLLSGQNLFLAGTPAPGTGSLVIFNTSTNTLSAVLTIQDGLHDRIAMTSNGRVYIGSSGCLAVPVGGNIRGCLAIFDTTKGVVQTAITMPTFSSLRTGFNVTGMQPISGRNVIYVIEGGELDIFDITTDALAAKQLDVVGKAIDVVQIDP